jgi:peptide/nickel transport system substrate-binding protein
MTFDREESMRRLGSTAPTGLSRRRLLKGAAATAPFIGLGALSGGGRAVRAADKTSLVVDIGTGLTSLDPDKYQSWNDYWAYGHMFEGLFSPNLKGELVPSLAESVDVSPDGLTYKFTLRAGAKFHNGDAVTTDDVGFSLQRSRDPAKQNIRAALIAGNIDGLEPLDDRRFIVHLKKIDAQTILKLGIYWQVKPKKYIESVGDEGFLKKPVGSGPFEFVEFRQNEYLKMQAFAGYWGQAPKLSDVTIKFVPEEQSRLAQVMAGEADVATPISPVLASRLRNAPNLNIIQVPSFQNVSLKFNPWYPETAKLQVRQALCMAIDRDALFRTVMLGFATQQELWCAASQPGCSLGDTKAYRYDPQRARELLQQAKFDFSKPLKFLGPSNGRVPQSKETCEAITEYLKRIGVAVDLQIMEWASYLAIHNAKPPKDPTIPILLAINPDPSLDLAYKLQLGLGAGQIPSWVADPTSDEMVRRVDAFTDMKEREAFMAKILHRVHEQAFLLPFWSIDTLYVTSKKVKFDVPPYYAYTMINNVAKAV